MSISPPTPTEVRETLEVLLESSDFEKSERSREFLRFVVSAKLDNRESEISQHALAASVFGRGESFDPNTDPIVRMQAGHVRRALEHYHLTHRDPGPVRITLPRGSYVPEFVRIGETPDHEINRGQLGSDLGKGSVDHSDPIIVVCPFANLTGDPELDYATRGLPMHIAVEADRNRDARIRVSPIDPFDGTIPNRSDSQKAISGDYCLRGALQPVKTGLRLEVQLIKCNSGEQIWAHHFTHHQSESEIATFLTIAASQVALMVFNEGGILYRHEIRNLPSEPDINSSTHEAILRFFDWEQSPDPDVFGRVVVGLQEAVQVNPKNGMAHSFLARCYATMWALGFEGIPIRIEDVLQLALKGAKLNPHDCRTRAIVGYVYLVKDEVQAALGHMEAALQRAAGSQLFLDSISYVLTLCGDWERGPSMLREAFRENPFHSPSLHGALWADALRKGDFTTAKSEAMATDSSSHFWGPLMRCVALAHLGQSIEAARFRDEILDYRPEFVERSDWLIRRFIKDDSLVVRIKEGLTIAGLSVT